MILLIAGLGMSFVPVFITLTEIEGGRWKPRGGYGQYISRRTAVLRYIPYFVIMAGILLLGAQG